MSANSLICRVRRVLVALAAGVFLLSFAQPAAAQNPDIYGYFKCYGFGEWTCAYSAFVTDTYATSSDSYMDIYSYTYIDTAWGPEVDTDLWNGGEWLIGWYGWDGDTGVEGLAVIRQHITSYELPGDYRLYSTHYCLDGCDLNPDETVLGTTATEMYAAAPQITSVTPVTVGASGTITLGGTNLVDAFYLFDLWVVDPYAAVANAPVPTIADGWTAPFAGYNSSTGAVTLSANIPQNAPRGYRNISLRTHFGTSNATILVGDRSPAMYSVVSKIGNNISLDWEAGNIMTVTVTGTGFGASPSVGINLTYQDTNCSGSCVGAPVIVGTSSDTQFSFQVAIGANEIGNAATIIVTSNGYDGNGFIGAQPRSASWGSISIDPLLATIPVVLYFGNTVPQNPNQQVSVGQEMALSAGDIIVPNGLSVLSNTWTVQGTVIGSYGNNNGAGPETATALTNLNGPSVSFYWVSTGGISPATYAVTYLYCLSNLQCSQTSVSFSVAAPTGANATEVYTYGVNVFLDNVQSSPYFGQGVLAFRYPASLSGIIFSANSLLPSWNVGGYQWVQLINSDQSQYINSAPPYAHACTVFTDPNAFNGGCAAGGGPSACSPELDGTYPYGNGTRDVYTVLAPNDTAIDGPDILLPPYGEWQGSFNATMYLRWIPNADGACTPLYGPCAIPVPLGSMTWWWKGDAINTLQAQPNGTRWTLKCGAGGCGQNQPPPTIVFQAASPAIDANHSYLGWTNIIPLNPSCALQY